MGGLNQKKANTINNNPQTNTRMVVLLKPPLNGCIMCKIALVTNKTATNSTNIGLRG